MPPSSSIPLDQTTSAASSTSTPHPINFTPQTAAAASPTTVGAGVNYQELLATITELQLDLQRTVALATKLKSENAGVRQNYSELKVALIHTRKRYADLRETAAAREEEINTREQEIEAKKVRCCCYIAVTFLLLLLLLLLLPVVVVVAVVDDAAVVAAAIA